jgi:hypothetical protein
MELVFNMWELKVQNPSQGMDVCIVCVYSVVVLSCV